MLVVEEPKGWVFPSKRSKSGHIEQMSDPFKRAAEAARMDSEKVIPHTLRHTAITRFTGSAPDLKTPQAFSGHESIQALLR